MRCGRLDANFGIDKKHQQRYQSGAPLNLKCRPRTVYSARIDDWLYLPEILYAFMLITVVSAGAGPYSLDALILSLIDNVAREFSMRKSRRSARHFPGLCGSSSILWFR